MYECFHCNSTMLKSINMTRQKWNHFYTYFWKLMMLALFTCAMLINLMNMLNTMPPARFFFCWKNNNKLCLKVCCKVIILLKVYNMFEQNGTFLDFRALCGLFTCHKNRNVLHDLFIIHWHVNKNNPILIHHSFDLTDWFISYYLENIDTYLVSDCQC